MNSVLESSEIKWVPGSTKTKLIIISNVKRLI